MTRRPDYVFTHNFNPVTAVCFGVVNTKDYLISGDEKGILMIWDLVTFKRVNMVSNAHDKRINKVWFNEDSRARDDTGNAIALISQARDEIKIWTVDRQLNPISLTLSMCLQASLMSMSTFSAITTNPVKDDEKSSIMLATSDPFKQSCVQVIRIGENYVRMSLSPKDSAKLGIIVVIKCIKLMNGCSVVLVAYESGNLMLFSIEDENSRTMSTECCSIKPFEDMITCMDYDPMSGKGACGSSINQLKVFTIRTEEPSLRLELLSQIELPVDGISAIEIRKDSSTMCIATWDQRVRIFSFKTLEQLTVIDYHKSSINCINFANRVNRLGKFFFAISSNDKIISLWSLHSEDKEPISNV
ncbi:guanine nucleotide-binding protein subunit beta-like protein 1 [Brevipalpus obovatus]|uniref:guanine nucleotide-binding protein subunit beta-like protein 1 n=1 Tax=Brevipalpus obovatus TaxID=246614 RepID=UPI003D9F4142